MPRRNTVNILQIRENLRAAIATCAAEAETPYGHTHGPRLDAIGVALERVRAKTDAVYLTWRSLMKERLILAKHLNIEFEQLRHELGEYGIQPEPSERVGYWEPDFLVDGCATLLLQLERLEDELPQSEEWHAGLAKSRSGFLQALEDEKRAREEYQRIAPLRREALYKAISAVEEFESVRSDYRR